MENPVEVAKKVIPTWKVILGVIISIIILNAILDALSNLPYVGSVGLFIQKPVSFIKSKFTKTA